MLFLEHSVIHSFNCPADSCLEASCFYGDVMVFAFWPRQLAVEGKFSTLWLAASTTRLHSSLWGICTRCWNATLTTVLSSQMSDFCMFPKAQNCRRIGQKHLFANDPFKVSNLETPVSNVKKDKRIKLYFDYWIPNLFLGDTVFRVQFKNVKYDFLLYFPLSCMSYTLCLCKTVLIWKKSFFLETKCITLIKIFIKSFRFSIPAFFFSTFL